MKGQIPGSVPGVLPFVRHGDDVGIVQMRPLVVAAIQSLRRWGWLRGIPFEPPAHIVVIELLAPQQPGQGLAHDVAGIRREAFGRYCHVELIGFVLTC
jgi:hypothetical protein